MKFSADCDLIWVLANSGGKLRTAQINSHDRNKFLSAIEWCDVLCGVHNADGDESTGPVTLSSWNFQLGRLLIRSFGGFKTLESKVLNVKF